MIRRVFFRPKYVEPNTTVEFECYSRLVQSRHIKRDTNHKVQRLYLARWVAEKIVELGVDAPWVEGKGKIKKASLHFTAKFLWTVVRYYLGLISTNNVLT